MGISMHVDENWCEFVTYPGVSWSWGEKKR
jgi:hypothetical protein